MPRICPRIHLREGRCRAYRRTDGILSPGKGQDVRYGVCFDLGMGDGVPYVLRVDTLGVDSARGVHLERRDMVLAALDLYISQCEALVREERSIRAYHVIVCVKHLVADQAARVGVGRIWEQLVGEVYDWLGGP